jgi:predicted helicase
LKQDLVKDKRFAFDKACLVSGLYRPFNKQWLYFNRRFNEMVYQMPRFFPNASAENIVIMVKQRWAGTGQLALMVNRVCDLQIDGGAQCFPLYVYDEPEAETEETSPEQSALFGTEDQSVPASAARRRDAITAEGLAHFQSAYPGESITSEDLFYYVYGLLHSPDYRERFADNLGKELPRIPRVKTAADFRAFSQAGRKLAELHLNYESVEPYPLKIDSGGKRLTDADYRVEKMRYGKKGKDKDPTTLHYNDRITLTGIPLEAYDYVVNGKPALDWVVERQGVKTDKDSGIVNDANDWAVETMGNPRYPLELFQRVVTVSLETMKTVRALPKLEIS